MILQTAKLWMSLRTSSVPHIFIVGPPRSGTTLLKSVLCAHPQIGGGDYESTGILKVRNLWAYQCGEIKNEETRRLIRSARSVPEFYDLIADRLLAYHNKPSLSEGGVFVDKLWPSHARLLYARFAFPVARFIRITRDIRDCYCSARKHPNILHARAPERFGQYFRRCEKAASRLSPERTYTLTYERLTLDAEKEMNALMGWLEVPFHESQLEAASRSKTTTMRKREVHARLGDAITTTSVGRWKSELTPDEVDRLMGRVFRRRWAVDPDRGRAKP